MTLKKILFLSAVCLQSVAATPPLFQEDHFATSSSVASQRYVLPPEIVCAHPVQGHSIPSDAKLEACAHAARSLYEKSQDNKTLCLWQFCVQKGYPLFKRDLEQLANALTDTNRCQDAYNLWKWFSENHPSSISGDHYGKYATYAFNAGEHALSYQMIRKHLVMSEYVKPSDYFTAAQASVFLKKFEDALKYYKDYFATQNPAYVPAAAYVNAAVTYHHLEDHKAAAKSMDIFFERYPNEKPEAFIYEYAGMYAYLNNEPEKAVRYFNHYFSMPASRASSATYVFAGQAHAGSGDQKLAIHYLEKYFELTPKSDWIPRSVFTLGYQYRQLGDYAKACHWFNHVFFKMNLQEKDFKFVSVNQFALAANAYLLNGEADKAQIVWTVLGKIYPAYAHTGVRSGPSVTTQGRKLSSTKQRTKRQKVTSFAKESNVTEMQRSLKNYYLERCTGLRATLEKMTFADREEMATTEQDRKTLLAEIGLLQKKASSTQGKGPSLSRPASSSVMTASSGASSSSGSSPMHDAEHSTGLTLTDVQLQVEVFERKAEVLKRLHEKAMQQRAKSLSIAYLRKLGTQTQEAISLPVARNQRGQYGHEKAQSPVCSSSAPASSTDARPVVAEAPKNHVVIKLHKDAQKQYETLLKLRGMKGKYDAFISEIMANPLQIEGTTGKTKLLKGETSLFSRRFDSGNRFVYHVNKTEDGTYEVLILSLLGHYKNLGHQVKVMHKN